MPKMSNFQKTRTVCTVERKGSREWNSEQLYFHNQAFAWPRASTTKWQDPLHHKCAAQVFKLWIKVTTGFWRQHTYTFCRSRLWETNYKFYYKQEKQGSIYCKRKLHLLQSLIPLATNQSLRINWMKAVQQTSEVVDWIGVLSSVRRHPIDYIDDSLPAVCLTGHETLAAKPAKQKHWWFSLHRRSSVGPVTLFIGWLRSKASNTVQAILYVTDLSVRALQSYKVLTDALVNP